MRKNRIVTILLHKLRIAKLETNRLRELGRKRGVSPFKVHLIVSEEENEIRKNNLGSRYFRSIYPTSPLTKTELDTLLGREAKVKQQKIK